MAAEPLRRSCGNGDQDTVHAARHESGGQRDYKVQCAECGTQSGLTAYRCAACDGPLVLVGAPVTAEDLTGDSSIVGIWRYSGFLPRTTSAVTLGEGSTPLLPLAPDPGIAGDLRVYGKLETLNPTLSFKDRAMALGTSVAVDLGLVGLSLASTGNAAVSAAAYAAAAGLPCKVVCATSSGAAVKLALAAAYGAEVELVDGDYSNAYERAAAAESEGWFNVTTTYRNPVLAEGYRSIAAEITEGLGRAPDLLIVPIGAGPLLRGLLTGFLDLLSVGAIDRVPRAVGVQTEACGPLARAWEQQDWLASLMKPNFIQPTSAGAIADSLRGYEREGLLTLRAVRDSGGTVVAVSEAQIHAATTALARQGVLVEPAAGAAVAALSTPLVEAVTPKGADVVVMLTGHGAKENLRQP